jgi:hypothetical protein
MSRFRPRSSPAVDVLAPSAPAPALPRRPLPAQPAKLPSLTRTLPEVSPGAVARIGFWILCAYMVSGAVNEWALRLAGVKGYLSVVTLVSLPVVWLVCGAAFRGLRHSIGWWWAAFLALLLIATPFSIWRGGSVDLLVNYVPRTYMLFFYVVALTISFRNCRQLMYVNIAGSFMALLTCIAFGATSDDGRYMVPGGAGFFENSNELAMQLLLGITQFVYLFSQKNRVGKLIAVSGIGLSIVYALRTGSRGCVIAAIAYILLLLYLTRHRVRVLLIITAVAAIGIMVSPTAALHRLTLLFGDETPSNSSELSAIASQMSRIALLKRSVAETIAHPLFGVGPGQFPVAVMEEAKAKNEWFQYLGTHNSYTQISSECGIPAFICYCAAIALCLRLNFRIWKRFRDRRECADIATLGVALLSGSVVYAVGSFFFHMAYSGTLPFLAGQTLALHFAAKRAIEQTK